MKLCIFIPFHMNLTFSGINNPQQRRTPPVSAWISCRPSWSPPWGGSSTPLRWRWSGAASCCGGDLLTSLSETPHKKLSFRLLSSELGGQISSKPLSYGLPHVFIDWLLNTFQKLHFVGIAEAKVHQCTTLITDISAYGVAVPCYLYRLTNDLGLLLPHLNHILILIPESIRENNRLLSICTFH